MIFEVCFEKTCKNEKSPAKSGILSCKEGWQVCRYQVLFNCLTILLV